MKRCVILGLVGLLLPLAVSCGPSSSSGLTITSFLPVTGPIGTNVTIQGTGFAAAPENNIVEVSGVPAAVVSAHPGGTELVVKIMPGTTTGPIKVGVGGDSAVSANVFTVMAPPTITDFSTKEGWQGTRLTITGTNFSPDRSSNTVKIGGTPAVVVAATPTELDVLVGFGPVDGPVDVAVGGASATSADTFRVLPWPSTGSGEDGPPIFFEGSGDGAAGDLPSTGAMKVLVCLSYPTDRMPGNLAAERQDIIDVWGDVNTFYDQASYNALDVQPEVTNWFALSGIFDDYYSAAKSNIDPDVLDRFVAECAQGAVDQGKDLDDYGAMACYIFANGTFLRAWGGWSKQNFAYSDGAGIDIDITADHPLGLMAIGENANWGRCAHEVAHNLVHAGAVLGEDVYTSDLIDPSQATATKFEMMGSHDTHPLFSGENIYQLDWFQAANVVELQWDRNPFSADYQISAHGLTEDASGSRVHLVRIQVTEGLTYYIETRQRPGGGSTQIFDTNIPLGAAPNDGGVVVTKVLSDAVNNNQETRFVTLLHDERVLIPGDVATDPLRALEISVQSETVSSGRLVSTVRVEWAQELTPDPDGDFDLRIEPWGPGYETVDIWIDRQPWGVFDNDDGMGNPVGNGDKPQVSAINRFTARARCDGTVDATNVRVTYYAVTPPGVGDNGNWTPIQTKILPTITAGSDEIEFVNWIPTVGDHTCLKVFVEDQLGEVTFGNNQAQENVFEFEPAADSPPDPLVIPLAIRNPRDEPSIVLVRMVGVPDEWTVHLPHHWVYLPARGERTVEAVVFTGQDVSIFEQKEGRPLNMLVDGRVPRSYTQLVDKIDPASRMLAIGGINAKVTPKRRGTLFLEEDPEFKEENQRIGLRGGLTPARANQPVEVLLRAPDGSEQHATALTDVGGSFRADFALRQSGEYKAQAFIVNAPLVAETQSNVVSLTK